VQAGRLGRAALASNISTPALFRYIEAEQPTLLIDEADSFLKNNEEMRGVLNSGHLREAAYVIRCEGEDMTPKRFSTWGPKAIAAIKKLPSTLTDRSVTAHMRRKMKTEKRPRYRDYDREEYQALRSQALRWANDNQKKLAEDDPPVPDTLDDRAADNLRPLLAIARCAGGEWPEVARKAALALSGAADDTIGIQLLRNIQWIFHGKPKTDDATGKTVRECEPLTHLWSEELVKNLVGIEDSPWADWEGKKGFTQNALARQLEPYGIRPDNIRVGDRVLKGYKLAWFEEAFESYLGDTKPCPPSAGGISTATTLQPNNHGHNSQNQTATGKPGVAVEKSQKPALHTHCSGVAVKNPPQGKGYEFAPDSAGTVAPSGEMVANGYAISHTPEDRRPLEPGQLACRVWIREIWRPAISAGPNDDLSDFAPI
jgi:putative DNA primase/helicase